MEPSRDNHVRCAGIITFSHDLTKIVLVKTPAGHFSFPKGKREKGETVLQNALRETEEETGIKSNQLHILKGEIGLQNNVLETEKETIIKSNNLHVFDNVHLDEYKPRHTKISVRYLIGRVKENVDVKEFKFDKTELTEVKWYTIEEALKLSGLHERRKDILRQAVSIFGTPTTVLNPVDVVKEEKALMDATKERWLSKTLTWVLRHKAVELGLKIRDDGSVPVEDLLKLPNLNHATLEQVRYVVEHNDKQRFNLFTENNKEYIRASQGHSGDVGKKISDEKLLTKILLPLDTCIHGTNIKGWNAIKNEGLKTMGRKHIHFAIGDTQDEKVISGFRNSSRILIYIDMKKAMDDGIEFFMSSNRVILSSGKDGVIAPKYFKNVTFK